MVCKEYETERRELLAYLEQYDDHFQNLDDVEKFMYILKLGNKRIMEYIYINGGGREKVRYTCNKVEQDEFF